MSTALEIRNLTKHYKGFTLDHVSFTVPGGAIVGLIGENGAGKSTTLKAALGLIRKDDGESLFWGEELTQLSKEGIGVVFDGSFFYDTLTPRKVGSICRLAYKTWDDGLYADFLKKFSLPEGKEIKQLSTGMKRKLAIAVALSHHPKLLILDEATSGLDPVMRDDILEVFLDFVQDEEHAILMSSHITTDLEKVADYIVFLHQGKLVFKESKDTLRYHYGIVRCGQSQFDALDRGDILAWRKEAYQYSVLVADKEAARRRYPDAVVDDAAIDDILLIYVKGEAAL